ncbi:DoxX family membrane protein [Paenibacillus rhizovicinus]|uniref:DoxX family membrane protein n=1 Tax=Paenibacillus rhizovicinus TaxID=2704463 RepID=A0A6C0NTW3_9BACL|nr:DoxX family protein [Paenibacillus rhizovicinus]QHW29660.1 DoxX family membrane protein [Paenibacillus rhizovicinus]
MAKEFEKLGLPSFFNFLTGSFEIAGSIGMIAGFWYQKAASLAGLMLGSTMLVAAFMLIVIARDPLKKALPAIVLSLLSFAIALYMI